MKKVVHYTIKALITVTIGVLLFVSIWTVARADIDYGPALDAAKTAALMQTGIQGWVDKAQFYTENELKIVTYKAFGEDLVNTTLVLGYTAYKQRLVIKPFRSPLNSILKHSLTLDPNSIYFLTSLEF